MYKKYALKVENKLHAPGAGGSGWGAVVSWVETFGFARRQSSKDELHDGANTFNEIELYM